MSSRWSICQLEKKCYSAKKNEILVLSLIIFNAHNQIIKPQKWILSLMFSFSIQTLRLKMSLLNRLNKLCALNFFITFFFCFSVPRRGLREGVCGVPLLDMLSTDTQAVVKSLLLLTTRSNRVCVPLLDMLFNFYFTYICNEKYTVKYTNEALFARFW